MENLLLLLLAPIAIFFGILYHYYSNSERKINISKYWKTGKNKIEFDNKLKAGFQKSEHKIQAFKHVLEFVVSSRNKAQKGLNELKIIIQVLSKNKHIYKSDLTILTDIVTEIRILINNLTSIKEDICSSFSEEFYTLIIALIKELNMFENCMKNLIKSPLSMLNNVEFVSHEIQTMETCYMNIVKIHSQLIKEFQTNISESNA